MSTLPSHGQRHGMVPSSGAAEACGTNGRRRSLHRIAEVRKQQGVSLRTAARHWNLNVARVSEQEDETADLMLSDLYRWQRLLEVPIGELLVDEDQPLSTPVMRRAQMLRLMKTAMSLQHKAKSVQVQRLAQMLIEQLVEIMPELANIGPWHGSDFEDDNGDGEMAPEIFRMSNGKRELD